MNVNNHVVMVASENDALIGGKVGGVGDVVRDLSYHVAELGWKVTTIIPSYGFLHTNNEAKFHTRLFFPFGGKNQSAEVWEIAARSPHGRCTHFVIEHPDLRGESIYFNDPPASPFKKDATKYALFCSATGQFLKTLNEPFVLHLHDWHAGVMLLLRELHPDFHALKKFKTIFTIHNLSLQGTRPMRVDSSSVEAWFPELFTDRSWIETWKDHRYAEPCFTPMAAGVRFADRVNTVSPTYAEEILMPNNPATGFHGGEGLEELLIEVKKHNRLAGIINGCEYPSDWKPRRLSVMELLSLLEHEIKKANGSVNVECMKRIERCKSQPPKVVLTTVTRVVEQKVRLLFEKGSNGVIAFDRICSQLESVDGMYIVLGNGTQEYQSLMWRQFRASERLLYIDGYFEKIARALYASGDLFVMPSLFEPCGISQMLAMRDGQPCVVHAVGGLKDTVADGVNGFTFNGNSFAEKVDNFSLVVERALKLAISKTEAWKNIQTAASAARFTWEKSAREYVERMYE